MKLTSIIQTHLGKLVISFRQKTGTLLPQGQSKIIGRVTQIAERKYLSILQNGILRGEGGSLLGNRMAEGK